MAAVSTSPTLTNCSLSSYDMVSTTSSVDSSVALSSPVIVDEDLIVWTVSEQPPPPTSLSEPEDSLGYEDHDSDDFVILERPQVGVQRAISDRRLSRMITDGPSSRPTESSNRDNTGTPTPSSRQLISQLKSLTIDTSTPPLPPFEASVKSKKAKTKKQSRDVPEPGKQNIPKTSTTIVGKNKSAKRKKKKKQRAKAAASADKGSGAATTAKLVGLGLRPIVDDLSAAQSPVDEEQGTSPLYEEAASYISSYLSNPEAKNNMTCRLTLLQSLIIELGLANMTSALPCSLKAAKNMLRSGAFINIKEYLTVRTQGQDAVRKLLYPSRKALIKDIRKKRNAASLKWVKEHGLQVLLVSCFR